MKKTISLGIIGIIISAMLLTSMVSPALANESSAYTPRAFVYGDANEDATVDMRDVTYIKLVIFRKKPETKLADANYDGKISMLDVGQTKLIVLGKEKELTLLDMADRTVTIPQPPERVAALSHVFIQEVMFVLGIPEDSLVAIGGCGGKVSTYDYTYKGEQYTYTGPGYPSDVLYPKCLELPNVGRIDDGINYEVLANAQPELVIIRVCCCQSEENVERAGSVIESLGIPVVIIKDPRSYDVQSESIIYNEIEVLGAVFDEQEKAKQLIDAVDEPVEFIRDRTGDIPEDEKPNVLYFGLSRKAREQGAVGNTVGIETFESKMLEDIVNAKNAFRGTVPSAILSSEQVLALNPDVIILPTSYGHHPPTELYESEHFKSIQEVKAIQEKRVCSIPATGCRSERLEFPIELMIEAKCCYPERFKDIDISEWSSDYYKEIYDIDDDKVEELKLAQQYYRLEIE